MTATSSTVLTRPSDREMVLTRSFAAPRGLVWQAWIDPAQLARWWGPDGFSITTHEHALGPGGVWRLTMHGPDGRDYPNRIDFLDVQAPARLVYRHAGEAGDEPVDFKTTVTLEEAGGVTTLTMHAEFATAADLAFVIKNYAADKGGVQTVGRLAAHVDMLTSEHPEFVITRVFDAPRELVWKAWTDPEMAAQWFGPKGCTTRIAKHELRPGGVWHSHMTMPDGTDMWGKFVYREVVPPSRLVWLHSFSDASENLTRHPLSPEWPLTMVTTVILEDVDGKTRITLTMTPHEATASERKIFVAGMAGMNMGWGGSFDQLAALLSLY